MLTGLLRARLRDIHLYVSLIFGTLFVLAGLTGAALAWDHELDAALNPTLLHSRAPQGAADIAPSPAQVQAAVERLSQDKEYGRPSQLMLPFEADDVYVAWYRQPAKDKGRFDTDVSRQVMLDRYTLQVLGERNYGEFGLSRPLLMPTLFHLHRYLLAGEFGKTLIGISGLLLTITSLLGLCLWWPKSTWSSLRKSLTVAGDWKSRRFHYSFHRSAGFFMTPILAVLGFTGMAMNLPDWVRPVVGAVSVLQPNDKVANEAAQGRKPIGVAAAMQAAQQRVPAGRISRVALGSAKAPYEIRLRQPGEVRKGDGLTRVSVDAFSGAVLRVRDPLTAPSGDTFFNWQFPLHTGEAFGLPGRVLVSVSGLMPLLFMITGLVLWLGRRAIHRRALATAPRSGLPNKAAA
ncbi:PepSY-associated TM helix domain-containing protein [Massilia endophytica]|uniref:PepSY-associated TM helix domain-containing protein n=1 Tax=Massilia endophytica TaxID=2899220 RepID=UPI001E5B0FA7|nr:PepSY-associated TM helix domain-containing protein [Massilia endophytica]UGQ47823.1 PepSY domain-containing protein [Massilia endophytica]